jgi:acyl dehydratase
MLTINGIDDLKARVGQELGVSDWHEVTQAEIDAFAEATDDHQFIHVDPERAKQTPFGSTIAHGLYTLSLGPKFSYAMFSVDDIAFGLNYGYEKVRFPAPVPVGSKLRMRAELVKVDDIAGGVQFTIKQTYEVEGGEKPVCVAESVSRVYAG